MKWGNRSLLVRILQCGNMSRARELRKKLGGAYFYKQYVSNRKVRALQKQIPQYFVETVVASLTVGCVKIEAVLYRRNDRLILGYDVFVKDDSESPEWIIYDSPEDEVVLKEKEILKVLERVVAENNLSYTECCFESLDGKKICKQGKIRR